MTSSLRRTAEPAASGLDVLVLLGGGDEDDEDGDKDNDEDDDSVDGDDNGAPTAVLPGSPAAPKMDVDSDVAGAASQVRPTDIAAGRPRAMEHLFSCLCWARPALL